MGKFFSDKVEEGIEQVWMSFDKEEMQQGFALLTEAAKEGDADGYCFLARCYMGSMYVWDGGELPEDDEKAALYVKESIARGSASGVLCAMRCGELTPSVRKSMPFSSLKEAFEIVLAKAEAGHPFCQYIIGNAYYWGDILEIEGIEEMMKRYPTEESYNAYAYPIAAEWYQKAFRGGFTFGFGNFRTIYQSGKGGIKPNPGLVEQWQKVIADAGDPVQLCNYGCALEEKENYPEALRYYEKAAVKGNYVAAYNAGYCYNTGKGAEKNEEKAFEYFMIAAKKGDLDGQFQVGTFYFEGKGNVLVDYAKAVYWLSKSAEQDCKWAFPRLGVCYQQGLGVQKDYDCAFDLFTRAEQYLDDFSNLLEGYVLNGLGTAYAFGYGTDEDIARGIAYYDRAIACGSDEARKNKKCFHKTMFGLGKWVRK